MWQHIGNFLGGCAIGMIAGILIFGVWILLQHSGHPFLCSLPILGGGIVAVIIGWRQKARAKGRKI